MMNCNYVLCYYYLLLLLLLLCRVHWRISLRRKTWRLRRSPSLPILPSCLISSRNSSLKFFFLFFFFFIYLLGFCIPSFRKRCSEFDFLFLFWR
jgi:hypothetical protein